MSRLNGKQIVLGVTGGIAAYKSPDLVRRLKDQGADVRVVMTSGAQAFITPLTLQAVSGHAVSTDLLDPAAELGMGHIELAKWADLVLIAPATANTLARLHAGMADDLLATICLATEAPIALAPAMNQQMYLAKPTQANLQGLRERGVHLLGPGLGVQACGDVGPGRMLEPLEIVEMCVELLEPKEQPMAGVRLMLTAGPTREAIDPVRYLSNHSSGKMGYALAEAARDLGATVTLVSGPTNLAAPADVNTLNVGSALEMHGAVMDRAAEQDIFIACAAVADYRAAEISDQKIKKTGKDEMLIRLEKNPDIVQDVAALVQGPFTVGFAAETQDVLGYARGKLERKKLDLIAANDVSVPGQGFNADQNAITLIWADGQQQLPLASKQDIARQLMQEICAHYQRHTSTQNKTETPE